MNKVLKAIACFFLISIGLIIVINVFDTSKSKRLIDYEQAAKKHRESQEYSTVKDFVFGVASSFELKKLRADLSSKAIKCFVKSTCSNQDYNQALKASPEILEEHKSILIQLDKLLKSSKIISISPNASMQGVSVLSLESLIKLKILEINFLFSKANSDLKFTKTAVEKSLSLDALIRGSLESPQSSFNAVLLLTNLKNLRSSLQKHSPRKVSVPKAQAKAIIKNVQTGDFIIFANTLTELTKTKSTPKLEHLFQSKEIPNFMFSSNRSLNLYVRLTDDYAQSDCVSDESIKSCKIAPIQTIRPVNMVGRILVSLAITSPLHYKKIRKISREINALHL